MIPESSLMKKIKIPPALVLWFVAPIFGELFSGSSPLNEYINPVTLLTLGLLYGCGAIICRELVIRWNRGWVSLLLLGFAYGIYEEGLLVQSFFDPGWQDLGVLAIYGRVAGVNWVWTEHLTIFHALISILASVVYVEILYPERRRESWVHGFWWVVNWIGFLCIYVLWEMMTTYDPGLWKIVSVLAIVLLVLFARFLPNQAAPEPVPPKMRPIWYFLIGFLGMTGQFVLIYIGAEKNTFPFVPKMIVLLVFDLLILLLILHWNKRGAAWDDRHRLALINGALCFFLILGPLTVGIQYPVMYYSNPVFLLILFLIARHVNRRVTKPSSSGEIVIPQINFHIQPKEETGNPDYHNKSFHP